MNRAAFTALLLVGLGGNALRAEIVFTGANITEDFDSLGSSVVASHFPGSGSQVGVPGSTGFDGAKIAGNTAAAGMAVGDGSGANPAGAIYSFGAGSGMTQSERALGALASGSASMAFGLALRNNMPGATITSITITFNQENWRTPTSQTNTLTASWGTSASAGVTESNYLAAAGMTAVSALNMSLAATATNTALDGNDAANRIAKSFTFSSLNLALNDRLFLRWQDVDNGGNDAGIGMDDMTLTFVVSVVPEARAWALGAVATVGAGMGWGVGALRRRMA
jgi:hypothetical protein